MKKTHLKTTSVSPWLGRMSPAERALGRYMRDETGHADAPPAAAPAEAAPAGDPAPAAEAAPEPTSILGDAVAGGADDAAKGAEPAAAADGDGAAAEAAGDPVADPEAAAVEATPYEGLTPPEGFEALDTDAIAAATPLMRAFGVADDKAQDFINQAAPVITGMIERATTAAAEAQAEQQAALRTEWANTVKADPELGGANYDKTVSMAAVALDKFFDEDTRKMLNITGLGNYPGVVKGWAKIGAHFAEGEIVTGEPAPLTKAHPLYDDKFLPPEQRRG